MGSFSMRQRPSGAFEKGQADRLIGLLLTHFSGLATQL
jgi:hypothetical protein